MSAADIGFLTGVIAAVLKSVQTRNVDRYPYVSRSQGFWEKLHVANCTSCCNAEGNQDVGTSKERRTK